MGELLGTYSGTVEDDNDPLQVGRMRCRVPVVYGTVIGSDPDGNAISTTELPWALPAGLPAGGTNNSGMIGWLPVVGDHVFVRFLDGEPEKPIWEWGGQDTNQAAAMGGWTRAPGGYDGSAPKSAFLTRYGHIFDIQPDVTTWRTANGYMLRFTDSTQQLDVYAPNMVGLIGSLKFTGTDYMFHPSSTFKVDTGATTISSKTTNDLSAITNTLTAIAVNKLVSPVVLLGPDGQASDPVVRLSDLAAVASKIMTIYNSHLHICSSPGKPTTPPTSPMILQPTASNVSFTA